MSQDPRTLLQRACADGQDILREVTKGQSATGTKPLTLTESPLRPFWIEQADSILFYRARKTGCLISRTHGEGFLIHRLSTEHPTLFRWSAPCFLHLDITGFGLGFGRVHSASFTVCMTSDMRTALADTGARPISGVEAGLLCGSTLVDAADFITAPTTSYSTMGAHSLAGASLDVSFASGHLKVDTAKNALVYGAAADVTSIFSGTRKTPPELQPLYGELSNIVHSVERVSAPSLTRSSLDRATLGYDSDQRGVVMDDGTLLRQ